MRITGIPKKHLLNLEEEMKIPDMNHFKRNNRYRSLVDTECSSINSKKEGDISQIQCEIIDENNIIKHNKEKEESLMTINPCDINTKSTIDSNKENETINVFKRKGKLDTKLAESNLNKDLLYLTQEKNQLIKSNNKEIEEIKINIEEIKKKRVDKEYRSYLKKKELIKEEHKILEDNLKEDIKYLENKIQLREEGDVLRSEHERVRENLLFHFEMKKKILNEKIKYYKTLIKEKNELHSHSKTSKTLLSNMDITNLNYNESSMYESIHLAIENNVYISKQFLHNSEAFDIQSSIVLKENNLIGDINAIKPKFFSTFN